MIIRQMTSIIIIKKLRNGSVETQLIHAKLNEESEDKMQFSDAELVMMIAAGQRLRRDGAVIDAQNAEITRLRRQLANSQQKNASLIRERGLKRNEQLEKLFAQRVSA